MRRAAMEDRFTIEPATPSSRPSSSAWAIMRRAQAWLMRSAVIRFWRSMVSMQSFSGSSGSERCTWREAFTRMSTRSKASTVVESRFATESFSRRSQEKT